VAGRVKQLKIIATHNSRYVSKEISSGLFFSENEEKRKAFELLRSFVLLTPVTNGWRQKCGCKPHLARGTFLWVFVEQVARAGAIIYIQRCAEFLAQLERVDVATHSKSLIIN
jgi:hypothetical protein